jgi:glycogen debranching enzyme
MGDRQHVFTGPRDAFIVDLQIDTFGDAHRDGSVEYAQQTETGLVNQGWKDSRDSIFYANGAMARGPIALCEL